MPPLERKVLSRRLPPWQAALLLAAGVLLVISVATCAAAVATLVRLSYELSTDFRLLRAREDLVHAALAALSGVGFLSTVWWANRGPDGSDYDAESPPAH